MKSPVRRENGEICGDHRELIVKTAKFSIFRYQNVKILEKNRALRAPRTVTLTSEIGHGTLTKGKGETLPK